jgi:hypothetical protein
VRNNSDSLVSVLLKSGKAKRVSRDSAEQLINSGEANRYISKTIFRALRAGVEVKKLGTRDDDGRLREATRSLTARSAKEKAKAVADVKKKAKAEAANT